jgi:hypothetical protein
VRFVPPAVPVAPPAVPVVPPAMHVHYSVVAPSSDLFQRMMSASQHKEASNVVAAEDGFKKPGPKKGSKNMNKTCRNCRRKFVIVEGCSYC